MRVRELSAFIVLASLLACAPAWAGTEDLSFQTVVSNTGTGGVTGVAGTGPWANVLISDTASADSFAFTVTGNLSGSQGVTGLFLDIPTAEAAKLTGVVISGSSVSGSPLAFVSGTATSASNSVFSASEAITGLTGTTGSKFDLYIKLPAGALSGTSTDTFTLTFSGADSSLVAASFLTPSTPNNTTAVGANQSPIAELSMSNSGGGASSGVAYITAGVVPEPATYGLMLVGLGLAGVLARRRTISRAQ